MKKINELIRRGLLIGILLLGITSCDRYEDDINDLRVDVDKLKLELSELKQAYDDGKIIKLDTTYTVAADYSYIEFQIEESDEFSGADFEYVYIDDHYTDPEDMERYRVDCYFSIAFESVAGYKLYSLDIHYEI